MENAYSNAIQELLEVTNIRHVGKECTDQEHCVYTWPELMHLL